MILSTGATNVLETTPAMAPNVRFKVLDYASVIIMYCVCLCVISDFEKINVN